NIKNKRLPERQRRIPPGEWGAKNYYLKQQLLRSKRSFALLRMTSGVERMFQPENGGEFSGNKEYKN
ncbi:MAG TPA: hypothetical protein PKE63_11000, partial [Lacibacter sp.]|nr:hypothetical protein [Lacibacter sp.]